MQADNPYNPPLTGTAQVIRSRVASIRPPYAWTTLWLVVGGCFLLLLNGQAFNNSLVFLGCAAVSGLAWLRFAFRRSERQRLARGVLLVHGLLMAIFALGLPAKYRSQQERREAASEFLQRARGTVPPSKE